jgi:hypothetical protein
MVLTVAFAARWNCSRGCGPGPDASRVAPRPREFSRAWWGSPRAPAVPDACDEVEYLPGLLDPEGGGGLVHDDDVPRPGGGTGDRDALALAAGERLQRLGERLEPDLQFGHVPGGLGTHAGLVQHSEDAAQDAAPPYLPAEEQVAGDIEGGRDGEVLVDGLDAVSPGVQGGAELNGVAVQPDVSGVGLDGAGERFDEGGLASTVVADDGQHLVGQKVEVGAVQCSHLAVSLDEAASGKDGGVGHRVLRREIWSTVTARMTRMPVIRIW